MKLIVVPAILLMSLPLIACASQPVRAQASQPEFRVTAKNPDDIVGIHREDTRTVLDVQSDFGIGSASIELLSGTMPDTLLLRLHITGLEDFELTSQAATVTASLPSRGLFASRQHVTDIPILPTHPLWLDIQIVSTSTKIPLEDGYFEIVLPPGFLRNAGAAFEIKWIDFYR